MKKTMFIAFILWSLALPVHAAAVGVIEGLQLPAWLERQGERMPINAGLPLQVGDQLITGKSARLLLRLNEGSYVKLGENAHFTVEAFSPPREKRGLFEGFMKVLRGAFRFTTTALSRKHHRKFDFQISTAVAGIRGTDIWGKAAPDRDIVCLLEGQVEVRRGQEKPVTMNEPLSFYIAPKDKPALPVAKVSAEQLKKWAAQTELTPRQGILKMGGRWVVSLRSVKIRLKLAEQLEALHQEGYPVEVITVIVRGDTWHRLAIRSFSSKKEAIAFRDRMNKRPEYPEAWVYRQ